MVVQPPKPPVLGVTDVSVITAFWVGLSRSMSVAWPSQISVTPLLTTVQLGVGLTVTVRMVTVPGHPLASTVNS